MGLEKLAEPLAKWKSLLPCRQRQGYFLSGKEITKYFLKNWIIVAGVLLLS
ncbi:hypothetical protein [Sporomusa termitida]|uniref:hypothetical protein n=1 Tax=Sporomusa termitida TaxID=2377 RepID=UPI001478B706|nr:hypothetical protein [Sporomusa termitida]